MSGKFKILATCSVVAAALGISPIAQTAFNMAQSSDYIPSINRGFSAPTLDIRPLGLFGRTIPVASRNVLSSSPSSLLKITMPLVEDLPEETESERIEATPSFLPATSVQPDLSVNPPLSSQGKTVAPTSSAPPEIVAIRTTNQNLSPTADSLPIPTVTVSEPAENPQNSGGPSNAALLVENVYVQNPNKPKFATEYSVCFEYGRYIDLFNLNRPNICFEIPSFDLDPVIATAEPEFLNNFDGATQVANGVTQSGFPFFKPVSNGISTALNNAVVDDVRRVQGNFYFDVNEDGIIENPDDIAEFDGNITNYSTGEYLVPYALQDPNNTPSDPTDDTVFSVKYIYNSTLAQWTFDGTNSTSTDDLQFYARFKETGQVTVLAELPESSGLGGILGFGGFVLLIVRRFGKKDQD